MTLAAKLLVGAIVGACLALLVSPNVRAQWLAGWVITANPRSEIVHPELTPPKSVSEIGQWVLLAAERIQRKMPIATADWRKLDTVVDRAINADQGNAYWLQMKAVFGQARQRPDLARRAWYDAARMSRWNDFQASKGLDLRSKLDPQRSGWSAAVAYGRQSQAATQLIEQFARSVTRQSSLETKIGLENRYRSLLNGDLIRKFARSIETGEAGARIVEVSAYPSDMSPLAGPHKLLLARLELQNKLKERGMTIQAEVVDRAFRNTDGWAAYANSDTSESKMFLLRWQTLFVSCLPGAFLWVAVVGFGLWGIGAWSVRSARVARIWEWPLCVVIGSCLGIIVILTTNFELAGLALAAAFCFLGWRPHQVRPLADLAFGPMYRFSLLMLSLMITLCILGFAMGASRVGWLLSEALGIPAEYYGASPIFAGVASLTFGLMVGIAPAFGWAYRINPTRIAAASFRAVGRVIALTGIIGSILLTPLSLHLGDYLNDDLTKILENEPLYYLGD